MKTNLFMNALAMTIIVTACTERTKQREAVTFSPPVFFNPPTYVCYKALAPITIDGKLSAEEWGLIPWTEAFVDIEGDKQPAPYYQTRAKMAYTEEGMYFAAQLEEPHVWATITEHDAVIFQDNNFEIFLNPSNDTHNYLEYEVNALGTEWDMFLSKPYRDPGCVTLSDWEFLGMKSAIHVEGTLNNPNNKDKYWSLEVFIPWKSIYQVVRGKRKPEAGDQIRVNFSRVEWPIEIKEGKYTKAPRPGEEKAKEHNWTWASTGVVNIHMPEYWGFVQFSDLVAGTGEETFIKDPDEDIKWLLRNFYYRQREYRRAHGVYAAQISELSADELCTPEQLKNLSLSATDNMYELSLLSSTGKVWCIKYDGLVWEQK